MGRTLALRPFVPARDFALSRRFYEALGFGATRVADGVVILAMERASFILQDFYVREFAENCMLQLLVRDAEAWWARVDRRRWSPNSRCARPGRRRCRHGG
jgi:hypothetical protein